MVCHTDYRSFFVERHETACLKSSTFKTLEKKPRNLSVKTLETWNTASALHRLTVPGSGIVRDLVFSPVLSTLSTVCTYNTSTYCRPPTWYSGHRNSMPYSDSRCTRLPGTGTRYSTLPGMYKVRSSQGYKYTRNSSPTRGYHTSMRSLIIVLLVGSISAIRQCPNR